MKDFYRLLGVSADASDAEVAQAYRRLVRETHPDIDRGDVQKFIEVQEAWETLGTPERRKQYDCSLRSRTLPILRVFHAPRSHVQETRSPLQDFFNRLWHGWPYQAARSAPAEPDFELLVDPSQALDGGEIALRLPLTVPCRKCDASGRDGHYACRACAGQGFSKREVQAQIRVPAGLRGSTRTQVPLDAHGFRGESLSIRLRVRTSFDD